MDTKEITKESAFNELLEITSDFISFVRTNLTYELNGSAVRQLDKIEEHIYRLRSALEQQEFDDNIKLQEAEKAARK